MTSSKVLRHINQETILTSYHHGKPGKTISFTGRRMENQISTNFDRKFYTFDRFAEKQFPYRKRSNVCADRLKVESPKLPANKKQWNENHRSLLACLSTTSTSGLQLVNRCKFHTFIHSFIPLLFILQPVMIHSFVYSFFNQSFIHSKINLLKT